MPSKVESPIRVTDNADGFSIAGGTTSRTLTVTGEAITLTATGATNVTLPTTGTLATLAGAESLTNKKLGSLTTNGFVKTSGGDGTLSVDTATYLTANQTITLTGNVTGSGATSIATTIAAGVVTNAMLAGSIAASKLTGTDIATVGTVTAGTWNATVIAPAYGGTGVANNAASTITVSGNFATTLTVTATTSVTLPTSGTLLTTTGSGASLTGIVTTITGTANQVVASASTGAVTLSTPQNIDTAATVTFGSVTSATIIGGTGTASTLTLRATSGVGILNSDIIFQTGNNGGNEFMRLHVISSNPATLGIGTATPDGNYKVTIEANPNSYSALKLFTVGAVAIGQSLDFYKTRGTTGATNTAVVSGDTIINITGFAGNGTNYKNAASIVYEVDGTPSASSMPGRIKFLTTPSGSNTLAERLRIDNAGNIIIGTGEASATVTGNTLRAVNAAGSDLAAVSLTVGAGLGTGTGNIGTIILQAAVTKLTTGSTAHSLVTLLTIGHAQNAHPGTSGAFVDHPAATWNDEKTAGSGTAATAVTYAFAAPTLTARNTSVTTTDAATVYIAGAPIASTNMTLTRNHALWVALGTVTVQQTALNVTGTWNASGVTFTANKTNITDTASAAFSLLEDWQVGGVSKAGVVKDGTVYGGGFFKTAALGLSAATNLQGMGFGATSIGFAPNAGNYQFSVLTTGANQFSTSILGWSSTTSSSNAPDTGLARAAAGVVEVNNGTAGTLKQLYAGTLRTSQTTVANLPSASTTGTGARAFVTDASTTVILGLGLTVVGGGANKVPVYSDGTNWIIG